MTFATTFNNCLYRKGWHNAPLASSAMPGAEPPRLARPEPTMVHGLGRTIALPEGFTLLTDSVRVLGPTAVQTLVFMGKDTTYLTLVFQQSAEKVFADIDYLVAEPFFLYNRGVAERHSPLRWALFAGQTRDTWITGLGGYLLVNKKERLTLVLTRPLSAPEARPPTGLRLSRNQHEEVEKFQAAWLPWLKAQAR